MLGIYTEGIYPQIGMGRSARKRKKGIGIPMTARQIAWYEDTLARFASGGRWEGLKGLTWCAACLGVDSEDVVADARAAGVKDRDSDIRRGIKTALAKVGGGRGTAARRRPRREEQPSNHEQQTVRRYIEAGRGATESDLLGLSPYAPTDTARDSLTWMRALWRDDETLFLRAKGAVVARLGWNLRTRAEWERALRDGEALPGDLVNLAAVRPEAAKRKNGNDGGVRGEDLEPCRFALLEFDDLPEETQVEFWSGFLRVSQLAPSLVSLVHSGGRSIHAVLDLSLGSATREERVRLLRSWFCSSPEEAYRADANALNAVTATRIPGVCRSGSGNIQRLLYLRDAMPNAGQSNQVAQNVHPDGGTGMEQTAREPPPERPRTRPAPKTDEDARRMDGRARGRIFRLPRDSEPPRTEHGAGFTPLDEILAYEDARESARACGI